MARVKEVYRLITENANPMPSYANGNRNWEHTIYATQDLAYRGLQRVAEHFLSRGYDVEEFRLGRLSGIKIYFDDNLGLLMTIRTITAKYEY